MLESKIYPFLKDSAMFYFSVLNKRDDGLYHIELTQSPEQVRIDHSGQSRISYGSDAVIDIAFIKRLMSSVLEASKIINNKDSDFIDKCGDVLNNLPKYPQKDGAFIDYDVGYFYTGDAPGQFKVSHRHPSRLTPIYPCCEIGLHSSDEMLGFGRASFEEFRSYGSEGFSGWSMAWQAIIAARLGLGDKFEELMIEFKELYLLPTGISSHNRLGNRGEIFQIEALLGAAAAVNESLVQSGGGIVYLFPGVPQERNASFKSLRVAGGFCVSAKREQGVVSDVEVLSLKGGCFHLQNVWNGTVRVVSDGGCLELSGDVLGWDTVADTRYCIG